MRRIHPWVIAGLLAACAGTPPSAGVPSPADSVPLARDSAGRPMLASRDPRGRPTDSVPIPDTLAPAVDTLAEVADSESAADVAILEQLATAHPESQDTGNESGTGPVPGGANAVEGEVAYDIDVETYGSHARVQFYLDFFQGPGRERMSAWLQRMPRYEPMIRAKLRENGVPEDMVYLALIESGFSNLAVSRARATGMWQFMKGTGKLYGLRIDSWVDERRDPVRATDAAARLLADLRDRFGSMYLAAAAYNAGAGRVGRGLRRLGTDEDEEEENPDAAFFRLYNTRYLRRETRDYVPKLIAAALVAKQPARYGFAAPVGVDPLAYDSVIVPDVTGLDVIARLADTTVAALRDLNPHYIRLVTPPRKESVVRLPPGRGAQVVVGYAALPPGDRVNHVEHIVSRGQTLSGIARMYRVPTRVVVEANPGVRERRLRSGARLMIPTSYVPPIGDSPQVRVRRAAGSSTATIRYRVQAGDALSTIAQQYGTTVSRLRALNALGRHEGIRAGQILRVPAPASSAPDNARAGLSPDSSRVHLVRSGETLSGIAARYRVSVAALRAANGLAADETLRAGVRLVIP